MHAGHEFVRSGWVAIGSLADKEKALGGAGERGGEGGGEGERRGEGEGDWERERPSKSMSKITSRVKR